MKMEQRGVVVVAMEFIRVHTSNFCSISLLLFTLQYSSPSTLATTTVSHTADIHL